MWQLSASSALMLASICLAKPGITKDQANGQSESIDGNVQPGEFPWLVDVTTLWRGEWKDRCDASLIHPRALLTSALCLHRGSITRIRFGVWDLKNSSESVQERNVSKVIVHEKFDSVNLHNNIAIIILSEPVDFDVVPLTKENSSIDLSKCFSVGWAQNDRTPKKFYPTFVNISTCQDALGAEGLPVSIVVEPGSFCSLGETAINFCNVSLGSPLVCPISDDPARYTQVGFSSMNATGCRLIYPVVWSRVAPVRAWIDKKLVENHLDYVAKPSDSPMEGSGDVLKNNSKINEQ